MIFAGWRYSKLKILLFLIMWERVARETDLKNIKTKLLAGVTQLARVTAFQAVGRGFESRLPLYEIQNEFQMSWNWSRVLPKGFLRKSPVSRSNSSNSADVAQLVEHILGKDEVTGSIPVVSSGKKIQDL